MNALVPVRRDPPARPGNAAPRDGRERGVR
jgi:hypothetical protein